MPQKCCVPGCKANHRPSIAGYVSVFKFPKNEELRQKWIESVGKPNWTPKKHSVVCIAHFEKSDISRVGTSRGKDGPSTKSVLRPNVVPRIFPALPSKSKSECGQRSERKLSDGSQQHGGKKDVASDPASSITVEDYVYDGPESWAFLRLHRRQLERRRESAGVKMAAERSSSPTKEKLTSSGQTSPNNASKKKCSAGGNAEKHSPSKEETVTDSNENEKDTTNKRLLEETSSSCSELPSQPQSKKPKSVSRVSVDTVASKTPEKSSESVTSESKLLSSPESVPVVRSARLKERAKLLNSDGRIGLKDLLKHKEDQEDIDSRMFTFKSKHVASKSRKKSTPKSSTNKTDKSVSRSVSPKRNLVVENASLRTSPRRKHGEGVSPTKLDDLDPATTIELDFSFPSEISEASASDLSKDKLSEKTDQENIFLCDIPPELTHYLKVKDDDEKEDVVSPPKLLPEVIMTRRKHFKDFMDIEPIDNVFPKKRKQANLLYKALHHNIHRNGNAADNSGQLCATTNAGMKISRRIKRNAWRKGYIKRVKPKHSPLKSGSNKSTEGTLGGNFKRRKRLHKYSFELDANEREYQRMMRSSGLTVDIDYDAPLPDGRKKKRHETNFSQLFAGGGMNENTRQSKYMRSEKSDIASLDEMLRKLGSDTESDSSISNFANSVRFGLSLEDDEVSHSAAVKISTGREERDMIDGIEFLAFETEHDMVEFTKMELDHKSIASRNITSMFIDEGLELDFSSSNDFEAQLIHLMPTKTNDITKIKSLKYKNIASTQNPLDVEDEFIEDGFVEEGDLLEGAQRSIKTENYFPEVFRGFDDHDAKKDGLSFKDLDFANLKENKSHSIKIQNTNKSEAHAEGGTSIGKNETSKCDLQKPDTNSSILKYAFKKLLECTLVKAKECVLDKAKYSQESIGDSDSIPLQIDESWAQFAASAVVMPSEDTSANVKHKHQPKIKGETSVLSSDVCTDSSSSSVKKKIKAMKLPISQKKAIKLKQHEADKSKVIKASKKNEVCKASSSTSTIPTEQHVSSEMNVEQVNVSTTANQDCSNVPKKDCIILTETAIDLYVKIQNDVQNVLDEIVSEISDRVVNTSSEKSNANSAQRKNKSRRKKKRYGDMVRELNKIGVNIIDIQSSDKPKPAKPKETESCNNDFCKLGCVCESLHGKPHLPEHCGRVECMFNCTCDGWKQKTTETSRLSLLSAGAVARLEEDNIKHLAREEKVFKQTVIRSENEVVMVGERKRREIKLPQRLRDSAMIVGREFVVAEIKDIPVRPKPSVAQTPTLSPEMEKELIERYNVKPCSVNVSRLHQNIVKNHVTFCLYHSKTNCICLYKYNKFRKVHKSRNVAVKRTIPIPWYVHNFSEKCARTAGYITYRVRVWKEKRRAIADERIFPRKHAGSLPKYTNRHVGPELPLLQTHFVHSMGSRASGIANDNSGQSFEHSVTEAWDESGNMFNQCFEDSESGELSNESQTNFAKIVSVTSLKPEEFEKDAPLPFDEQLGDLNHQEFDEHSAGEMISEKALSETALKTERLQNMLKQHMDRNTLANMAGGKLDLLGGFKSKLQLVNIDILKSQYEKSLVHMWLYENRIAKADDLPLKIFVTYSNIRPNILCTNIRDVPHEYLPDFIPDFLTNNSSRTQTPVAKEAECAILVHDGNLWQFFGTLKVDSLVSNSNEKGHNKKNEKPMAPNNRTDNFGQPVEVKRKWYAINMENEFNILVVNSKRCSVRYALLRQAITLAQAKRKTMRVILDKNTKEVSLPKYGIYVVPGIAQFAFIGPYGQKEDHGLDIFQVVDDKSVQVLRKESSFSNLQSAGPTVASKKILGNIHRTSKIHPKEPKLFHLNGEEFHGLPGLSPKDILRTLITSANQHMRTADGETSRITVNNAGYKNFEASEESNVRENEEEVMFIYEGKRSDGTKSSTKNSLQKSRNEFASGEECHPAVSSSQCSESNTENQENCLNDSKCDVNEIPVKHNSLEAEKVKNVDDAGEDRSSSGGCNDHSKTEDIVKDTGHAVEKSLSDTEQEVHAKEDNDSLTNSVNNYVQSVVAQPKDTDIISVNETKLDPNFQGEPVSMDLLNSTENENSMCSQEGISPINENILLCKEILYTNDEDLDCTAQDIANDSLLHETQLTENKDENDSSNPLYSNLQIVNPRTLANTESATNELAEISHSVANAQGTAVGNRDVDREAEDYKEHSTGHSEEELDVEAPCNDIVEKLRKDASADVQSEDVFKVPAAVKKATPMKVVKVGRLIPNVPGMLPIPACWGEDNVITIPHLDQPGKSVFFSDLKTTERWLNNFLKRKVTFVPSDFRIRWLFQKCSKESARAMHRNLLTTKQFYMDKKNVITPHGVFHMSKYSHDFAEKFGVKRADVCRIKEKGRRQDIGEYLTNLGKLLSMNVESSVVSKLAIIRTAIGEIQKLERINKSLSIQRERLVLKRQQLFSKFSNNLQDFSVEDKKKAIASLRVSLTAAQEQRKNFPLHKSESPMVPTKGIKTNRNTRVVSETDDTASNTSESEDEDVDEPGDQAVGEQEAEGIHQSALGGPKNQNSEIDHENMSKLDKSEQLMHIFEFNSEESEQMSAQYTVNSEQISEEPIENSEQNLEEFMENSEEMYEECLENSEQVSQKCIEKSEECKETSEREKSEECTTSSEGLLEESRESSEQKSGECREKPEYPLKECVASSEQKSGECREKPEYPLKECVESSEQKSGECIEMSVHPLQDISENSKFLSNDSLEISEWSLEITRERSDFPSQESRGNSGLEEPKERSENKLVPSTKKTKCSSEEIKSNAKVPSDIIYDVDDDDDNTAGKDVIELDTSADDIIITNEYILKDARKPLEKPEEKINKEKTMYRRFIQDDGEESVSITVVTKDSDDKQDTGLRKENVDDDVTVTCIPCPPPATGTKRDEIINPEFKKLSSLKGGDTGMRVKRLDKLWAEDSKQQSISSAINQRLLESETSNDDCTIIPFLALPTDDKRRYVNIPLTDDDFPNIVCSAKNDKVERDKQPSLYVLSPESATGQIFSNTPKLADSEKKVASVRRKKSAESKKVRKKNDKIPDVGVVYPHGAAAALKYLGTVPPPLVTSNGSVFIHGKNNVAKPNEIAIVKVPHSSGPSASATNSNEITFLKLPAPIASDKPVMFHIFPPGQNSVITSPNYVTTGSQTCSQSTSVNVTVPTSTICATTNIVTVPSNTYTASNVVTVSSPCTATATASNTLMNMLNANSPSIITLPNSTIASTTASDTFINILSSNSAKMPKVAIPRNPSVHNSASELPVLRLGSNFKLVPPSVSQGTLSACGANDGKAPGKMVKLTQGDNSVLSYAYVIDSGKVPSADESKKTQTESDVKTAIPSSSGAFLNTVLPSSSSSILKTVPSSSSDTFKSVPIGSKLSSVPVFVQRQAVANNSPGVVLQCNRSHIPVKSPPGYRLLRQVLPVETAANGVAGGKLESSVPKGNFSSSVPVSVSKKVQSSSNPPDDRVIVCPVAQETSAGCSGNSSDCDNINFFMSSDKVNPAECDSLEEISIINTS